MTSFPSALGVTNPATLRVAQMAGRHFVTQLWLRQSFYVAVTNRLVTAERHMAILISPQPPPLSWTSWLVTPVNYRTRLPITTAARSANTPLKEKPTATTMF